MGFRNASVNCNAQEMLIIVFSSWKKKVINSSEGFKPTCLLLKGFFSSRAMDKQFASLNTGSLSLSLCISLKPQNCCS